MKRWAFLISLFAGLLPYALAQPEEPVASRTAKGQIFFSGGFQNSRKKLADNRFYQTPGLELSAGHYLLPRLALRVSVSGQQYNALEMLTPAVPAYDQERSWNAGAQVRYNFWELPRLGTVFVQTGYSYGRISGQNQHALKRWEVISAGETLYLQKVGFPKLAIELKGSLEKESITKRLALAPGIGINYYPGLLN